MTLTATATRPGLQKISRQNAPAIRALALRLHDDGYLHEARRVYGQLLDLDPAQPDLLHLLGVLHVQLNEPDTALELLERAIAFDHDNVIVLRDLGEVYRALARFSHAVESFRRALEIESDDTGTLVSLGHAYLGQGQAREAEVCYRRALRSLPVDSELYGWLGVALMKQEKEGAAQSALHKAVELDGRNDEARFQLAALAGETPESAPASYIQNLFDCYAPSFEQELTGRLGYDVPQLMRAGHAELCPDAEPGSLAIADLGCGTGLAGTAFVDLASHLLGVDLSGNMLQRANDRQIYDELVQGDLCGALATLQARSRDLLLAADVFVYLGDLDAVVRECRRVLCPGGHLMFSTEWNEQAQDYRLQRSTRFAHGRGYIERLAHRYGFLVVLANDIIVRHDHGEPVPGKLWMLTAD